MAPKKKINVSARTTKVAVENGTNILNFIEDIELENEDREKVRVKEIIDESSSVIFLYPKANTPGCTKQVCGFQTNYSSFVSNGFHVYGLSKDKPEAQKNFKNKNKLKYSLLCDPEGKLIKLLGCDKNPGIIRSHVVIAKGGTILDIQRSISPVDSYERALAVVKSVGKTGNFIGNDNSAGSRKIDIGTNTESSKSNKRKNLTTSNKPIKKANEAELTKTKFTRKISIKQRVQRQKNSTQSPRKTVRKSKIIKGDIETKRKTTTVATGKNKNLRSIKLTKRISSKA